MDRKEILIVSFIILVFGAVGFYQYDQELKSLKSKFYYSPCAYWAIGRGWTPSAKIDNIWNNKHLDIGPLCDTCDGVDSVIKSVLKECKARNIQTF
jgi:hypothetical protein